MVERLSGFQIAREVRQGIQHIVRYAGTKFEHRIVANPTGRDTPPSRTGGRVSGRAVQRANVMNGTITGFQIPGRNIVIGPMGVDIGYFGKLIVVCVTFRKTTGCVKGTALVSAS